MVLETAITWWRWNYHLSWTVTYGGEGNAGARGPPHRQRGTRPVNGEKLQQCRSSNPYLNVQTHWSNRSNVAHFGAWTENADLYLPITSASIFTGRGHVRRFFEGGAKCEVLFIGRQLAASMLIATACMMQYRSDVEAIVHASARENVCNKSKKRKKSRFSDFEKNVKKRTYSFTGHLITQP